MNEIDLVRYVAKLVHLTQKGKIIWERRPLKEKFYSDESLIDENAFYTDFDAKKFLIYKFKSFFPIYEIIPSFEEQYRLVALKSDTEVELVFPNNSVVKDLYETIQEQSVTDFFKSLGRVNR